MSRSSRQHFPEEYLANLKTATETVLMQVKETLAGLDPMPCTWLKLAPAYPAFCDQAFAYRNQIFAYLIDTVDANGNSTLESEAKERLLEVAKQNNLVPCRFPVKADHTPLETGWNLRHLESGEAVVPQDMSSDVPTDRSDWERLEIALQCAVEWVHENRAGDIITTCAIPGADPQIWFHETTGGEAWILVTFADAPEYQDETFLKDHPTLKSYNGYECRVTLKAEGNEERLYRGHAVLASTEGPKKVHTVEDNLFTDETPLGSLPPCLEEPKEEKEVDGKGCLVFLVAGVAAILAAASTAVAFLC